MRKLILGLAALLAVVGLPRVASASIQLSMGFNYNRTTYSPGNYSWTRRWGASVGYEFTDRSELEFSFQDIIDRTKIEGYEDTTFHDRVYSLNWVQNLTGRSFPIQPYVKVGIGQLNRDAKGSYASGAVPTSRVDSVTGVLGAGMRIYLTRSFALRIEATSYLEGGSIPTWKDNLAATFGASYSF